MAYYEPQAWQAPVRQGSWEQPAPPSRSGTSSTAQRDDSPAFASQFDEVDRAVDNLVKSGKLFNSAPRRDSVPPMTGRPYADYDPRMMAGAHPPRHHSVGDYDAARPHSASNLQGFYAAQRFQGRPNEAEQMMQAKRRLAAQRERDLRNYHQEQQYNRSLLAEMSGNKSDRSMSPAAMSEESRRELIARQHRALYGHDSAAFYPNGGLDDRQASGAPNTTASAAQGHSPRGVDPFGGLSQVHGQPGSENPGQHPTGVASAQSGAVQKPRSRANSTSSPNASQTSYNVFEQHQQSTSTSSPGVAANDSPNSRQGSNKMPNTAVGPIGTRLMPASSQAPNSALATSSASNPVHAAAAGASNTGKKESSNVALGWGNGNGVWRSKGSLGVQASVWG
ncbi:hypothetical protein LOZ36_000492 [Ophidiomyces ophidiicola]|nr:hypothetical protein LOZ36_000492 [Ophidiomyces ophidiicola]